MRQLIIVFLLFTGLAIQSCKEGCKDKKAINYDSKASLENGTCLYCSGTYNADTATYSFNSPNNSQNPNAPAIEFIVVSTSSNVSGNGCLSEGKTTGGGCNNYLTIVNLTGLHVDGSFFLQYFQNNNQLWFFQENNFIALGPPGSGTDTLSFGIVDSVACSNLTIGTLTPSLGNLQFF